MSDGGPKRDVNGALVLLGIDGFLSLYKDTTLCSLASSEHGPFHLDDYVIYSLISTRKRCLHASLIAERLKK